MLVALQKAYPSCLSGEIMPHSSSLHNQWPTYSDYTWYTPGGYGWPTSGDDEWYTPGDYGWYTPGDHRWYTPLTTRGPHRATTGGPLYPGESQRVRCAARTVAHLRWPARRTRCVPKHTATQKQVRGVKWKDIATTASRQAVPLAPLPITQRGYACTPRGRSILCSGPRTGGQRM